MKMTKIRKGFEFTRRNFIYAGGAAVACSLIPAPAVKALTKAFAPLYLHTDLSYFDTPIAPAPADIHFGYASITWNGNDRQAIDDIAAVGYPGIQLRANAIAEFENKPAALLELLNAHKLKMVALSSGYLDIGNPQDTEVAAHVARARFAKDAGAIYMQVIGARPKGRSPVREDYEKMGKLLMELSKRTADIGVQVGFHNHMDSLGEKSEEVDWIFASTDPRYAKLELDVAHCVQGGGDPVKMMTKYSDRLLFMHLKDVRTITPPPPPAGSTAAPKNYQFVELGRGRVDFPAVFANIEKIKYRGWAIVELDAVPEPLRTPKDCAETSKKYLADKLGYKI
jgi:inosose dehydratase